MPARRGVTRFTVMAMLQAARAETLGLSREESYSWGLNRAIFYAAAKRGFRGGAAAGNSGDSGTAPETPSTFRLGDDEARLASDSATRRFQIGDEPQTPEEFARQIAARFGSESNFRIAWSEAVAIVRGFPTEVLESRNGFYSEVYKPRRDALASDWTERFVPGAGPTSA